VRRLHFGWNHKLLHDTCRDDAPCAIPILDPIELADEFFIAGLCGKIARSAVNKTIPYNLKLDRDVTFDQATGDVQFGKEYTGLSCATFVVAVFRSSGNPLVDTANWPMPTKEDIAVQREFVALLEQSEKAEDQAQAILIRDEIGTPRARPEHVAGACLEDMLPVSHAVCDENGKAIVPILDGWREDTDDAAPLS